MPELPEVETTIARLRFDRIIEHRIVDIVVDWERTVGGDSATFRERVVGTRIDHIYRRGKYILISLSKGEHRSALVAHLRMSGRLYLRPATVEAEPYERLIFRLDDERSFCFYDPRKFGRVLSVDHPEDLLGHLGVDPLDSAFTPEAFYTLLARRRRQLKPLLLDQRVIAGLGNIYCDESLWCAQLHPLSLSNTLRPAEAERLFESIRYVLYEGIRHGGTQLGRGKSNFATTSLASDAKEIERSRYRAFVPRNQENLRVFQRTGSPCRRCGETIERIIVGQRASHICPRCQPFSQRSE